jgi:hypothetical protein
MSIADNAQHRARWLENARHIQAEIRDLITELDIGVQGRPPRSIVFLIAEADVHCEMSLKELDEATARIRRIA